MGLVATVDGSWEISDSFLVTCNGNSVYPALPVSFGGETKSCRSLLSGVYVRGSKISHQSALEMCNFLWTPHSSLEKETTLSTTPVLAQVWAVWSIHN